MSAGSQHMLGAISAASDGADERTPGSPAVEYVWHRHFIDVLREHGFEVTPIVESTDPERRLADVERYCRTMRNSMTVPAREVAEDILDIIRSEPSRTSTTCGQAGHANGCGCHLKPITPPVTVWEEASQP